MDYIVSPLRYFECSESNGRLQIQDKDSFVKFTMTKKPYTLEKIITTYNYVPYIGGCNIRFFDDCFICYEEEVDVLNNSSMFKYHTNALYWGCELFSLALWFIKDNSIFPAFVSFSSTCKKGPMIHTTNRFISTAKGDYTIVDYSNNEIKIAMKWLKVIAPYFMGKQGEINTGSELVNSDLSRSLSVSSFRKAFEYLKTIREMTYLPEKMGGYVTILEILFAVDGENTQRVSERVAFFISENKEERVEIFNQMRSCYGMRSWYVHGKYVSDKRSKSLPEQCVIIDDIVRRVLKKFLSSYIELDYPTYEEGKKISKWFDEYIMTRE